MNAYAPLLGALGHFLRKSIEPGHHGIDGWIRVSAKSVALREPARVVVGQPCFACRILRNQRFQR